MTDQFPRAEQDLADSRALFQQMEGNVSDPDKVCNGFQLFVNTSRSIEGDITYPMRNEPAVKQWWERARPEKTAVAEYFQQGTEYVIRVQAPDGTPSGSSAHWIEREVRNVADTAVSTVEEAEPSRDFTVRLQMGPGSEGGTANVQYTLQNFPSGPTDLFAGSRQWLDQLQQMVQTASAVPNQP